MGAYFLLTENPPVKDHTEVPWLHRGNPNIIGMRLGPGEDLAHAAMTLDAHAKIRGLRITHVAQFKRHGIDCVFALGEPEA
jgi:hypothetical protein